MRISLAIAALLAATSVRAEIPKWEKPTLLEGVVLVAAETTILIDMLQTIGAQRCRHDDYMNGRMPADCPLGGFTEWNPLMGKYPSRGKIIGVSVTSMLATAAIWYALPPGWRTAWSGVVFFVEGGNVAMNFIGGAGIRF
jgi:hypothetical protein